MTRKEERIEAAKKRYGEDTQYLIAKSQAFIVGAKWADETMIERAVNWLVHNMASGEYIGLHDIIMKPDFIEKFRKAMK